LRAVSSCWLLTLALCMTGVSACSATRGTDSTPVADDILAGLAADILEDNYQCNPYENRPGELAANDPTCKDDIRKTIHRELEASRRQRQRRASAEFRDAFNRAIAVTETEE
jgi:hypothetical protein